MAVEGSPDRPARHTGLSGIAHAPDATSGATQGATGSCQGAGFDHGVRTAAGPHFSRRTARKMVRCTQDESEVACIVSTARVDHSVPTGPLRTLTTSCSVGQNHLRVPFTPCAAPSNATVSRIEPAGEHSEHRASPQVRWQPDNTLHDSPRPCGEAAASGTTTRHGTAPDSVP